MKTGLLVSAVVYLLFSLTVAALAWPLVHLMAQEESLQEETVDYIRLELVAIVSYSLDKLLKLVMVLHQWNSSLYLSLFVQVPFSKSLSLCCLCLLFSVYPDGFIHHL